MSKMMCPGQDTRYWRPGDIFEVTCAKCGYAVEMFKDDARRRCPKCGNIVKNPRLSLGCAQWCEHAKECLGYDPRETIPVQENSYGTALVDQLIMGMKKVFGKDQKRIDHAFAVLSHAKEIIKAEKDADPKIVMAAAILHDIGIHEAEAKHGSSAPNYQELEGPIVAGPILDESGMDPESKEHVLKIIANHHSGKNIDTIEFRIVWDADWLENFESVFPELDDDQKQKKIERLFKTAKGKEMALAVGTGKTAAE
ncbi:MAG: HD domain-containing protein [Deltaproteobacteria bacterium]|nr:HD domain-containing protein [Deltaproteobacteria bacterium]